MNVGDSVYVVSIFPGNTGIRAGKVEDVSCACCVIVRRQHGSNSGAKRTKRANVAESMFAARELMRIRIKEAKDGHIAEVARLDAIDVNAVETQDL